MMSGETEKWRVEVNHQGWSDNYKVWIVRRDGADNYLAHFDKDGFMVFDKIKEGTEVKRPSMLIPRFVYQMFIDALTEKTPPTKKEAIDAELGATKYHLEDLRKLVFKESEKVRDE